MMHIHRQLQSEKGEINHGLSADLELLKNPSPGVYERVDLVPDFIQIVLRDFYWTGDIDYLKEMWPSVKKAINYILTERDKNHDRMPDMDGIMSSYDNFPMYGLASYIQSQWLASMLMTREAALIMNDRDTYTLAATILTDGSQLMEDKLWNGDYYYLSNDYSGPRGVNNGILTDQILGQWIIYQTDLGLLFPQQNISRCLESILKNSFITGFGLRNCTFPEFPGLYPIQETDLWVDQANTCWSGVELAFAGLLLYDNKTEQAIKLIRTVDERYRKAGLYWDHQEFGGHYYRALSAWSVINGYLGLGIRNGNYSFSPKLSGESYRIFFSYGNGTARFEKNEDGIGITVLSGTMKLASLGFPQELIKSKSLKVFINNEAIKSKSLLERGKLLITFSPEIIVESGSKILIRP
jgi:uncharacterized protein (DUF608 family)